MAGGRPGRRSRVRGRVRVGAMGGPGVVPGDVRVLPAADRALTVAKMANLCFVSSASIKRIKRVTVPSGLTGRIFQV